MRWQVFAACRGLDPALFHPEPGADAILSTPLAKAVCAKCPAREACLDHALAHREPQGVWGGTSPAQRRRILRRRAKEQAA